MKNTITKTMVLTILALLITAISTYSQNNAFSGAQNMGATFNTASEETGPVMSPNGLSLYFTSNRPSGQGLRDIYVSQRAALNLAWGAPQNLGVTVNTSSNENITGFSLDGRSMLMTSDRTGRLGGNDIWLSTRPNANNDFGWTTPVNLGATINSEFQDITGDFFEDPATGAVSLIFSSDRIFQDGLAYRFYQSTRNPDGTFNAPVLIDELNGPGGHFGSSIRRDGLEIFITSARFGSINLSTDVWRSTRASVSAPWTEPVLVPLINDAEADRQPKLSPDGSILYFSSARAGGFGSFDLYFTTRCSLYAANSPCVANRNETADFDGDGRADLSVFRPSDSTWYVMQSGTNTFRATQFGLNGDKITPGDYDGDGRTDLAVFRPSTGVWWISRSSDGSTSSTNWGISTDKPIPGDYDGDGRTDIAVYRNGTWYIIQSSTGNFIYQHFGLSDDIPVAANVQ